VPAAPAELRARIAALARLIEGPLPEPQAEPAPALGDDEALLQAIYAAPDDDGPRAVYADVLTQRGDARGELIMLQLQAELGAASRRRVSGLLKKHRRAWLGPLAKMVTQATVVFERGFVAACETDLRRKSDADAAAGLAEWATVRRVRFHAHGALGATMSALEEARGVPESALAALGEVTLPRLRSLEVKPNASRGATDSLSDGQPGSRGLELLARGAGVPVLTELCLRFRSREWTRSSFRSRGPADYAWLLDGALGRRLERLAVCVEVEQAPVAAWVERLRGEPGSIVELVLVTGDWALELDRRDGVHARVRLDDRYDEPPAWAQPQIDAIRGVVCAAGVTWDGLRARG
jgi:uncharacterized protein (TIGR02996 family)